MLTGTLELLLSVEDFISIKLITFAADTFSDPFGVLAGDDGGADIDGGGSRGGGSDMGNLFASAVASADVRPAPLVAVAETAVAAA